jgi:hypothetical protein
MGTRGSEVVGLWRGHQSIAGSRRDTSTEWEAKSGGAIILIDGLES